jgi:hypothetical protein
MKFLSNLNTIPHSCGMTEKEENEWQYGISFGSCRLFVFFLSSTSTLLKDYARTINIYQNKNSCCKNQIPVNFNDPQNMYTHVKVYEIKYILIKQLSNDLVQL